MEDFKIAKVSTLTDETKKVIVELIFDEETVIEWGITKPYVEIITDSNWKVQGTSRKYQIYDEGVKLGGTITEDDFETVKDFIENRLSGVISRIKF